MRWAALPASPGPADSLDGPPVDADDIRERIADILADPRYRPGEESLLQRLFGPLYDWLERMIGWVMEYGTRAFRWLLSFFDAGVASWLGPTLVVMAAAVATFFLGRRRTREIERRTTIERILELGRDPAELEAMAEAAASRGDHAEVIRLRFVAGLLRLDAEGRIEFYPGMSNGAIAAELDDPTFVDLADQFDRVVYGRRPTFAEDAERAGAGWRALLGARR